MINNTNSHNSSCSEEEDSDSDQSDQSDQSGYNISKHSNIKFILNLNIGNRILGNYSYKENSSEKTNKTIYDKNTPFIDFLINKRINNIDSGSSSHIAAFMPCHITCWNNNDIRTLPKFAIGQNSERLRYKTSKIKTHAEIDALNKIECLLRINKIKKNKVNLIVLRTNRRGDLRESAPCYHCTKELSQNSNIKINKLYFSRDDGTISCIKFNEWEKCGTCHVSKGWRWLQKSN